MLFNQYCFSLDVTEDLPVWHAIFKEDNNNIYLVMIVGIWSGLKILSTFIDVILTNQHQVTPSYKDEVTFHRFVWLIPSSKSFTDLFIRLFVSLSFLPTDLLSWLNISYIWERFEIAV